MAGAEETTMVRRVYGDRATLLGACLFLFVAIKVLVISRFDTAVALGLVGSAGAVSVVLGSLLLLAPFVAIVFWGVSIWLLSHYWFVVKMRSERNALLPMAAIAAVVAILLAPWALFAASILIGLQGLHHSRIIQRRHLRWVEGHGATPLPSRMTFYAMIREEGILYLCLLSFVGLLIVLSPFVWMPAERVSIDIANTSGTNPSSGSPKVKEVSTVGYVIEDEGEWSTLLVDADRSLLHVKTADLMTREICTTSPSRKES
jgi:hypothetical protein